jgi:hypothetical protein
MRKLVPFALALVLAAPAGSASTSGLRGIVRKPTPVCLQNDPCDGAAAGVAIVFSRNGKAVKRVTSRAHGRYSVALAPGTYSLTSPDVVSVRGRVIPSRVRVYAGRYRRIDVFVDTGVRAP